MPPKLKQKEQKPRLSQKDRIIKAAFDLSARQGWRFTTVRDIADAAGISLAAFYDSFDVKEDILVAYGLRLDAKVLEVFSDLNPETPVRDMLFDIMMERFDLASADRAAIKSILQSLQTDPKLMIQSLSHLGISMTKMLEAAGVDTYGWKGALRTAGLTAATLWATKTWLDDDSRDLSKTMSALDNALSKIDNLAGRFNL